MFYYIWPILLVILSNIVYQICAKSMPDDIDPFAALTVTYLTAAIASLILYFSLNRGNNLLKEYGRLNWVPFAFGVVLVGLEVGFVYAYKAGWEVSAASIVQSAFLSIALLFVGYILYKEPLTWNKIVGVIICLIGLGFINYK